MSKKPIKKSDEGKEWLTKRPNRNIKSQLEYHLIICEGTKTEPNYFESIKEQVTWTCSLMLPKLLTSVIKYIFNNIIEK